MERLLLDQQKSLKKERKMFNFLRNLFKKKSEKTTQIAVDYDSFFKRAGIPKPNLEKQNVIVEKTSNIEEKTKQIKNLFPEVNAVLSIKDVENPLFSRSDPDDFLSEKENTDITNEVVINALKDLVKQPDFNQFSKENFNTVINVLKKQILSDEKVRNQQVFTRVTADEPIENKDPVEIIEVEQVLKPKKKSNKKKAKPSVNDQLNKISKVREKMLDSFKKESKPKVVKKTRKTPSRKSQGTKK